MTMTKILRNTSAILRRNIRRAKLHAQIAAYNPVNIYLCYLVLDIIF